MKTPRSPRHSYVRRAAQTAALLTGFVLNAAPPPQENGATPAPTKDHVLFVGTDLSVKQEGKFYHVVGATRKTLKIEKDHAVADVRLSGGANIRINKGVKLSNLSATIAHVQMESSDREAARAQLAAMQASMMLADEARWQADRLQGKMLQANYIASVWDPDSDDRALNNSLSKRTREDIIAAQKEATDSYADALPNFERLATSTSTLLNQNLMQPNVDDDVTLDASALPGLNLLGGSAVGKSGSSVSAITAVSQTNIPSNSTEVELTFDVSSPEPLENAYIVVVANYASASKPNEMARQISAREFARIDRNPKRVKMSHAASMNGLPFKKFDMGLFANGQEVATNLSEKRMALTSDQAYQFFLIDYLTAHKGATLPPAPMLMKPRAEIRRQLEKAETSQTIYANVDKSGNVLAVSADAEGTQRLPVSVESVLQNVRFMPALTSGAPVQGRIKMTLAQLAN